MSVGLIDKETPVIEVVTIDTRSLGDRTYLVTDGVSAFVIDPQRDVDRVFAAAAARGVAVTDVFETHIHNDYVSGGLAVARRSGASYYVNAADQVAFSRVGITDGDIITVGQSMRVRVIATPGHTFTHLAYALQDAVTGEWVAVFTGGSLLYGSTGRPDLLGSQHTHTLAAAQHASAQRLVRVLPDQSAVYPTHGFGSFCAATTSAGGPVSTIGQEKGSNPALTLAADKYVAALVAALDDYPAYYAHMAALNRAGPDAADPAPPAPVTAEDLDRRIAAGEWVVDLRHRRAFAAGHVAGSFSFEFGDSFATYLGWLIPWGAPLTLIGETGVQIAAAQRELSRIGVDRLAGAALTSSPNWPAGTLATYSVSDFAGLAAERDRQEIVILDVRRAAERAGGYIEGSRHVPLHELPSRLRALPHRPVWVHCQGGYRASIAASLLHAAGHEVTAVDGDFGSAAGAGLALSGPRQKRAA
jgi:hydroxyacylglutathione hydrolase